MLGLQSLLSSKHKTGVDFSVSISYFSCSKIQVAKTEEQEWKDLNLKEFSYAREYYNPYAKVKKIMWKAYEGHKSRLDDFWANLQENFKVKEKRYSRFSVLQIRNFEIEINLPKDLRDDYDFLDPIYKE